MTDLRRAIRIAVDLPARVRSHTLSVDGRAGNISQSGILFVGSAPPIEIHLEDGQVHLEIDLPDAEIPVAVGGEIRWSAALGLAGIRFTDIAVAVRRRLANFVMRRAWERMPLPR